MRQENRKKSERARKQRKRRNPLHVLLSDEEIAEFKAALKQHGMISRELIMNSLRCFQTISARVDALEAQIHGLIGGIEGGASREKG